MKKIFLSIVLVFVSWPVFAHHPDMLASHLLHDVYHRLFDLLYVAVSVSLVVGLIKLLFR